MKYPICLSLLLCLSFTHAIEQMTSEYPVFKIDLNLPPEDRFTESVTFFKEPIMVLVEDYLSMIPKFALNIFKHGEGLINHFQPEYYAEMVGISKVLNLEMEKILVLNYLYEITSFCTSIVARQADGTIIHGRNLDFSFADSMRDITFVAQFYRGEVHQFDSIMFAGDIGVYTGIKHGAFSASENQRRPDETIDALLDNLKLIFKGKVGISWLIREALTKCGSYECAVSMLTSEPIIAPGYIILAGTKEYEGMVISRNHFGPAHIEQLSIDNWYVAQTNDDHFTGVCQNRCIAARAHLDAVGQDEISLERLFKDVMLVGPTMNSHTIFTAMMSAKLERIEAYWEDSEIEPEP